MFYGVRIKLTSFLLAYTNAIPEASIEEALKILHELEPQKAKKRAAEVNLYLGFAYKERLKGDRQHNYRRAIAHYEQAAAQTDAKTRPLKWALAKVCAAEVYSFLGVGDRGKNIRKSIRHLKDALKVYSKDKCPEDYKDYSEALEVMTRALAAVRARGSKTAFAKPRACL